MSAKELERAVREAIAWAEYERGKDGIVKLTMTDAKRLLYRLKKENAATPKLVYRKDEK